MNISLDIPSPKRFELAFPALSSSRPALRTDRTSLLVLSVLLVTDPALTVFPAVWTGPVCLFCSLDRPHLSLFEFQRKSSFP